MKEPNCKEKKRYASIILSRRMRKVRSGIGRRGILWLEILVIAVLSKVDPDLNCKFWQDFVFVSFRFFVFIWNNKEILWSNFNIECMSQAVSFLLDEVFYRKNGDFWDLVLQISEHERLSLRVESSFRSWVFWRIKFKWKLHPSN